jgi:quercetin dioxygenase-like cupin family protein
MPFYRWSELASDTITPKYSTTHGATVNGTKLSVGLYKIPAGTGARPHAHPNEQVIAVVNGRMRFRLGGEERVVGPGEVILIPPNTEHQTTAIDDVEFFNCKDLVPGFSIHEGGWIKGKG